MRRSRSPASSYCGASGRDNSDWDVWAFKVKLRLRSGTPYLALEVSAAQKGSAFARDGYLHQSPTEHQRAILEKRGALKRGAYRRAGAGSGGKHATRARSSCTRFRIYPPNDAPSRRFCLIGFFISAADDQIACGLANDKVAAFVLGAAEPLLPNNF